MTDSLFRQAAVARCEAASARADRPRQRRSAEQTMFARSGLPTVGASAVLLLREAADSGTGLTFDGIASATEMPYEMYDMFGPYNEVITAGAFTQSLNQKDLDCPLVLGHDQMRRIASTANGSLKLSETDNGLRSLAENLDPEDADVAYVAPKLRSGLLNEMSFGFRIDQGVWSPDYSEFRINQVNLHRGDVSIVGFGANPHTSSTLTDTTRAAEAGRYTLGALHALFSS